jgi:hypothetical protein
VKKFIERNNDKDFVRISKRRYSFTFTSLAATETHGNTQHLPSSCTQLMESLSYNHAYKEKRLIRRQRKPCF